MINPLRPAITGALTLLLVLCCLAALVELRLIALALLSIAQEVYVTHPSADAPADGARPKESGPHA